MPLHGCWIKLRVFVLNLKPVYLVIFITDYQMIKKHYSYGQQVFIPPSYPQHFIITNKFSPIYIAEMKRQEKKDEFDF